MDEAQDSPFSKDVIKCHFFKWQNKENKMAAREFTEDYTIQNMSHMIDAKSSFWIAEWRNEWSSINSGMKEWMQWHWNYN